MTLAQDPKITAALDLLRSGLQEAFLRTSESCAFSLRGVDLEVTDEVTEEEEFVEVEIDPALILRESIQSWREISLERITVSYGYVFAAARDFKESVLMSADVARDLAWGEIDQFFYWDPPARDNAQKFTDWLKRCRIGDIDYMADEVWPPFEGVTLGDSLEARLNREFHTSFERLLTKLRNEALLTQQDVAAATAPGHTRPDDNRPEPYVDPPDLESKDDARRGKARAWMVERAIRELDYLRPLFEKGRTAEELSTDFPDFLVFQEKRLNRFLITAPVAKQAYKEAALEVAAARIGRARGTVENAWKKYKRYLSKPS